MENDIQLTAEDFEQEDRYSRLRLIPWWDQERLKNATVMVVGAGAIGNELIKNLTLLGIGRILVYDMDAIENTNLTRSVLYRARDVGRYKAEVAAERDGVDMRMYRVIYDCIEEITDAMKGMLAPKTREVLHGRAEVRQVYKITGVGTVAGCYILDGKVYRNDLLRIVRDGIIIGDDKMISLRRFKDDMKEVAQGYECGIGLERFTDIREGDIYETYIIEEYRD